MKEDANRKYIAANRKIKEATGIAGEVKASMIEPKHKRALFNVLRDYDSVSLTVEINKVYDNILADKMSIVRYKDYVLKRLIKIQTQKLILQRKISRTDNIEMRIFIDEQLTASDGRYSFEKSVQEELSHGIYNFDYGFKHPNVIDGRLTVSVDYRDSKNNYLIQACDILANRIWTSYVANNTALRNIPNHTHQLFP